MSTNAKHVAATDDPQTRSKLYDPDNFFAFGWPAIPRRQFVAERDRALAGDAPSGEIALDASDALETPYPATTPLLLARYLRVRAGETLARRFEAAAIVAYVMRGSGNETSRSSTSLATRATRPSITRITSSA